MNLRMRYSFFLGIVFVWSLVGYPVFALSANMLDTTASEISIAARATVALSCAILFLGAVKTGKAFIMLSIFALLTIDVSRFENMFGTMIFSRFEAVMSGGDVSSLARLEQLGSVWSLFEDYPLRGAGLKDPAYGIYPHNVDVAAFMALGRFGGLLLVILVGMACKRAFRLARSNSVRTACGALYVQYGGAAEFSRGLYGSSTMWMLLGRTAGVRIPRAVRQATRRPGNARMGPRLAAPGLSGTARIHAGGPYPFSPHHRQAHFTGTNTQL